MTTEEMQAFFEQRVPKEWFTTAVAIEADDDEILCVGTLTSETPVEEFRERTRAERMTIADAAEERFGRKVSWGVARDGATTLFTTQNTPVMTRLRLRERRVLDTLVEGGVARSRSEALAWCVKLVARHQSEWLGELREALVGVEHVRADGPSLL